MARAWAVTGALLQAFRDETAARGSAFALVEAPAAPQVYDDLWQELARRGAQQQTPLAREHPDERLLGLSRRAGIPFLSLLSGFRAAAPGADSTRADEQLYYEGRFHWNDRGNELAAAAIHAFLAALQSGT